MRYAKKQFDHSPSLTLRATEIQVAQTSQMSGWRSHKIHLFDDRRIRQINPVLRTQTNMTPGTYALGTRNRQAESLPYN